VRGNAPASIQVKAVQVLHGPASPVQQIIYTFSCLLLGVHATLLGVDADSSPYNSRRTSTPSSGDRSSRQYISIDYITLLSETAPPPLGCITCLVPFRAEAGPHLEVVSKVVFQVRLCFGAEVCHLGPII